MGVLAAVERDEVVDFLVETALPIAVILVTAFVLNRVVRRAINRFAKELTNRTASGDTGVRSAARAKTIASVLRGLSTAAIYSIAVLTVLGEFNIDLAPLIAGAGIVGLAIGFGAQSLVKDFLAGIFILIEDQYGVGDIVDVGDAAGTVEALTLRATRLRDGNGTVWHVPNGQIVRVGNKSQQWARAVLDITVASGSDVAHASEVIKRVADEVWRDEVWSGEVLEEPEVWGVEDVGPGGVTIRVVVKTQPAAQFKLMRELRARVLRGFEAEGIELPAAPWPSGPGPTTPKPA